MSQAAASGPIVQLSDVYRSYFRGREEVRALRAVSMTVSRGEFVVVTGPSGAGKSTLLHVMAGLDLPDEGTVFLEGTPVDSMSDDELTLYRRRRIGFIFQFFHLLPTMSAAENVMLPLLLDGQDPQEAEPAALEALGRLGLDRRASHRPRELSGGEQQRVAIARALVSRPALLLADEPTGNLDSASGAEVYRILKEAPRALGTAVVLVTHDPQAAEMGNRQLFLRDGLLTESGDAGAAEPGWAPLSPRKDVAVPTARGLSDPGPLLTPADAAVAATAGETITAEDSAAEVPFEPGEGAARGSGLLPREDPDQARLWGAEPREDAAARDAQAPLDEARPEEPEPPHGQDFTDRSERGGTGGAVPPGGP